MSPASKERLLLGHVPSLQLVLFVSLLELKLRKPGHKLSVSIELHASGGKISSFILSSKAAGDEAKR
jgi:hypothetical protein